MEEILIPDRLRRLSGQLIHSSDPAVLGAVVSLQRLADELERQPARLRKVPGRRRRLLGKQVVVTLEKAPGKVVIAGRLLGFGADGAFEIEEPDGTIHYCWPMLNIEETK